MAFAKCVPHSVEGIMMGLIGSIIKINSDILMRLLGLLFLINTDITVEDHENHIETNFSGLSNRMYTNSWYLFLACFLIRFIFDRKEFVALQRTIAKMEKMTPAEIKAMNIEDKTKFLIEKKQQKKEKKQKRKERRAKYAS
jgi:hypothetical protein